jgi:hypothetical protein
MHLFGSDATPTVPEGGLVEARSVPTHVRRALSFPKTASAIAIDEDVGFGLGGVSPRCGVSPPHRRVVGGLGPSRATDRGVGGVLDDRSRPRDPVEGVDDPARRVADNQWDLR